jgi:catechol-2,3-dioxygenase
MAGIERFGHAGIWVDDLGVMRDFYTRVLGLQVTDESEERGFVFLSSHPEVEHHELLLARGRQAPPDSKLVQQLSWRVDGARALVEFHERFKRLGVPIQQEVTHGNALSIYFLDPEGNRNELYWPTGVETQQPFSRPISFEQSADDVLAEAARILEEARSVGSRQ